MIPAPALSLVFIAAGKAMGLESPPLPALKEIGQLQGGFKSLKIVTYLGLP
jgi:hypothetical protein